MNFYNRIKNGFDAFVTRGGGFKPTKDTKKITLNVTHQEKQSILLLKETYDKVWDEAKSSISGTDLDGRVADPNINAKEAVTYGYLSCAVIPVFNDLYKKYGASHVTGLQKLFIPYMKNSIHNLLRHDLLYGLDESKFNETLYGRLRLMMVDKAIDFIVWMTVYGFSKSESISMWLTNPEKIAEVFPRVPHELHSIEDSNGKFFDKGRETTQILNRRG